jgi:hypothetical protein
MLQRRGVFKTSVTRIPHTSMSPEIKGEVDAAFEGLDVPEGKTRSAALLVAC